MKNRSLTTLLTIVLLGSIFVVQLFMATYAQAVEFPKKGKRIKWVVTHSPGGGYDTCSRKAALTMQKILNTTVTIKNVPGAGGRVGVNEIYRSKPDGYTIGMIAFPGMMITQLVSKTRFDLYKLKYIGRLAIQGYCLSVNPKSPFKSLQDLRNAKKPLRCSITGGGTGTIFNIVASDALKFPHTMVSGFKGSVEAIIALMAGDVDYTMTGSIVTHARYANSGDIRVLFTATKKRHPALPNVPAVTELGIPLPEYLFNMNLQRVVVAPPGTPDEIVAILRKVLKQVAEDKEFVDWGEKVHAGLDYASGEEMLQVVNNMGEDMPKFRHLVEPFFKQ
ncbi:tripartite tricarboxylate transporter substrate binding protein [Thermodesulfobacteriota bacterium]